MKWWIKGIMGPVLLIALAVGGAYFYTSVLLHGKTTEKQDDAISNLCGILVGIGLVVLWGLLFARYKPQPRSRTTVQFQPEVDIRPVLQDWAHANGFVEQQRNGPEIIYQRGAGVLMYPMMFSVRFANDGVHFAAWVRASGLMRLGALYLIPEEMGIESGGWRMALPRKVLRTSFNKLLGQLGQPLIG